MSVLACRNALKDLDRDHVAHAGQMLHFCLERHEEDGDEKGSSKRNLLEQACQAVRRAEPVYRAAFNLRTDRKLGTIDFRVSTLPGERVIVGLGCESPLDVGLTLHHTYGAPLLPGSALKGLAQHYCETILGADDPQFRKHSGRDPDDKNLGPPGAHAVLFGTTAEGGFITFEDAWLDPDSLGPDEEGLLVDIMTPHHNDRSATKPPSEFDNPVPVPFLSVRGKFQIVLRCADASEQGRKWLQLAREILTRALEDWGIGGKTSSGYGRLVEPARQTPAGAAATTAVASSQRKLEQGKSYDAELLKDRTKAGGWRAQIVGTTRKGPVFNWQAIPAEAQVGEILTLKVRSVGLGPNGEIQFEYVPPGQTAAVLGKGKKK